MTRKRFLLEQVDIKLREKEHIMQKWEYAELSWETYQVTYQDSSYPKWYLKRALAD